MSVSVARSCTRVARIICLAVLTALVPVFAVADDSPNGTPKSTIKASAAQIVAREVAAAPARLPAREKRQGTASTNSTSFFRTRPGMIALAVVAVGAGYALYSAHNDRIHSPGRQ